MTLGLILLGTVLGGLVSVLLAASLALTVLKRYANLLVSFAVGALLTAALIGMLPEALRAGLPAEQVGAWVLIGLLVFFLLEKSMLWRHQHRDMSNGGDPKAAVPRTAVPMVVIGDALHNFVDGVAIAAAFLVDPQLGFVTAGAVLLHEIPQELGDFMVMLAAGVSRGRALLLNMLSGAAMVAGGVLGYAMLDDARFMLPIVLALAAASFIYVAVSDLVPHLQRQARLGAGALQVILMVMGSGAILFGQAMTQAFAR